MKTITGAEARPPFKIIGTNAALRQFEADCRRFGFAVSANTSYFREDYEHCLMPAYAYCQAQPGNVKLQTLSADVYYPELVYDLATQYDLALALVKVIQHKVEQEA